MNVRWMISCLVLAFGCTWVGCAQSSGLRPGQQVTSSDGPESAATAESSDTGVVTASYSPAGEVPVGPRVSVQRQLVMFGNQPEVAGIIQELWGDTPVDKNSGRSRVVATHEILATLEQHETKRLVGRRPEVSSVVSSGSPACGKDEIQRDFTWQVTPTVEASDVILISITGQPGGRSASGQGERIQKIAVTAELRPGQTLIVEGPDRQVGSMQVAKIPVLGDIPIVGDRLFSKTTTTLHTMKSLYLISAEVLEPGSESED